jgi:hypothetical protein
MAAPTTPIRSSLPTLRFTDDLPRQWPSIFVYGVAGAGKTYLLRSIAHLNPLVLATELGNTKGLSTLRDLHLPCLLLNSLDELVAITTELAARSKPGELFYGTDGPFNALAVDSLTGVGAFLEDAVKRLKGWDMIWDAHAGGGKDPRSAYPYIAEKGRQIVARLMALPAPLVMTCREQLVSEGEGAAARSWAAPELPGQRLPRELPGWPEATLRLRVVNGQRVLVTETEGDVVARLRTPIRVPKYVKPDLGSVIRLLQGDASALSALVLDAGRRVGAGTAPTPTTTA